MMGNNRNLIILAAVVVVLGAVYALSSQRRPSLDTSGGFVDLVKGTLSTDELQSIGIHRGEGGFTLVNGDEGWVVQEHFQVPANLNKIRTLLGNLEGVSGEFRSDDAGVLASYALEDSQAYHLEIPGELDLLIGKRSGAGCFVRDVGSNRVYATDYNFLSDFGVWGDDRPVPEVSSWVNLLAFEVKRENVTRVRIEGKEPVVLDREVQVSDAVDSTANPGSPGTENHEWRVNGDFVAGHSKGEAIVTALAQVRARDVLARGENPEASGLDHPQKVTVTLDGANDVTLLFGNAVEEMSGQVWFRVDGRDLIWAVPEYVKTNLFKTASELRAE